ncbi:MAG TPA: DMT family transporter [Candidatus Limnocylindria bacterium]|nr:DMT family transporter [Candidatus Limnocylindria bacterium]
MNPLLAGLGAAVAWGVADYAGGLASRRIPAIWTSIGMQASGAVLFGGALLVLGRWPALDGAVVAWGAGLAAIGASALLFLYRGLALGPIAVVSPISAGYSAITVLLVVVFLGDRVSVGEAVAIAVTFAGIALASTDLRQVLALRGRPLPGVPSALVAMVGFGAWGALIAAASRDHDELALILVGRAAGFLFMILIAFAMRSAPPGDRRRGTLAMVLLTGAVDTLANVLFVFGVASGEAAIVATASGMYPLVPAVLAIVFLGERLAPNQYAGVAVLIAGLAGLGLQR